MSHIPHYLWFLIMATLMIAIIRVAVENHEDRDTIKGKVFNAVCSTVIVIFFLLVFIAYW